MKDLDRGGHAADQAGKQLGVEKAPARQSASYDPGLALHDPGLLLGLQRRAGNAAVSALIQRAQSTASAMVVANPPAEQLYHLTIGNDDRNGITKAEALKMLKRHYSRIKGATEAEKDGLADLRKIHEDQWIVAGVSDVLGGVKMPDDSIFDSAFTALAEAKAAMDGEDLPKSADKLMEADFKYQESRNKVSDYREGTISGASRSVTVLKVTVAAGAVAATVATGGTATAAGAGLLGTAGAVAVGAGTYGEFSEMGTQGGEMISGKRQAGMFDPIAIIKRAGTDAVVGFVGALAGGALSKFLVAKFGAYLISNMSEEALAAFGEAAGVTGQVSPELVVSAGQKFIIEFFANMATTPLTTAVQMALDRLTGKYPGHEKFTDLVVANLIQGGIMQVFVAAVTHGWSAAGLDTGMQAPSSSGGGERGGPAREGGGETRGSGLELDTNPTPVPPEQQPQMRYGEVSLDENGPSLELDTNPRPVPPEQQPQMSYGERDLPAQPGPSGLKVYQGSKPILSVMPKAKRIFGAPSNEPGGTGKRTGMAFHEYNAAEMSQMKMVVDYDPVAGRPRSVTYEVHAGKPPAAVSDRGFSGDTSTEGAQPRESAFNKSGYDLGHLGQRQAAAGYEEAERATDLMTNIVPMEPALNRGKGSAWVSAEQRSFDLANQVSDAGLGDHVVVNVEPVYAPNPPTLKDGTPIPEAFIRTVKAPDGTVLESNYYLNQ